MLTIRSPGIRTRDSQKIRLKIGHMSIGATHLIASYKAEHMPTLLHMPNILRELIISLGVLRLFVEGGSTIWGRKCLG
jgi:hypothetical protein